MRKTLLTLSAAGSVMIALLATGITPAAFADTATTTSDTSSTTSTTGSSTAPSYCSMASSTASTTEGYFVFTDQPSYTNGQMINFCILDNTRNPLFLTGTHPWMITDQNGDTVFTPQPGTFDASSTGTSFFTDMWNGMISSTTNAATGTYRIHFSGFPGSPFAAFTIAEASSTSTTTSGTGTTTDLSNLISQLMLLQGQFPSFFTQIQAFITQLNSGTTGTSTPPATGTGTIDQNGQTFMAGGSIDFAGRNFSHETDITVSLNGQTVGHAHADGGGNFSTGSMSLPSTAGTYTYYFSGNGTSVPATITVR